MSCHTRPFTLQNHIALGESRLQKVAQHRRVEVVSKVGSRTIIRIPPSPVTVAKPAHPLPAHKEARKIAEAAFVDTPSTHGCSLKALKSALTAIRELDRTSEFFHLAVVAEKALACLASRARAEGGEALYRFAGLGVNVGEAMSQFTKANPKALQPVARHCARWPVMRSTHPLNCDPDERLGALKMGAALPVCIDEYCKWKPDYAAQVAVRLLEHLRQLQEGLPEFCKDSAPQWWKIAREQLLQSYPEPQNVPELLAICAEASRKSPGRIRERILTKIKARFLNMART